MPMNTQDRQYIDAVMGGLKGVMEERFKTVFFKQDEMIEHQKRTNGRVLKLESELPEIRNEIECIKQNNKILGWVSKNPIKSGIVLFTLIFLVVSIADQITLLDLLNLVK